MRMILITTAAALVLAAPAQASWHRVERAKTVAADYWEASPDCPTIWTLKVDELPSYYSTPGPWWAMATDPIYCVVYVRRSWTASWPVFCTHYLHEIGHLMGHEHSTDPRNVMFHNPRVQPVCR